MRSSATRCASNDIVLGIDIISINHTTCPQNSRADADAYRMLSLESTKKDRGSIIHVLECFLRVIKGHRIRISMRSVFAWYKQMEELYTIAVFLVLR